MDRWRTIVEPFRIHSVEPIRLTSVDERERALEAAGWNLFGIHAEDVLTDPLTDSGTGAMSRDQWAAIQRGDESYAGSPSWYTFLESVQTLFPFPHVIPTHQGRAAEKILFSVLGGPGRSVPNNTHFDTTRANVEYTGAEALDLAIPEGRVPSLRHPFKGNMDTAALDAFLGERTVSNVPVVFMTVTNNSGGGQPVSLENLRTVRAVCDRHGVPLFLDACRFAENAWFIKQREPGQADRAVPGIVLAMRDDRLAEACRTMLILTEGFPTYGGLAGRDLEAIAQGYGRSSWTTTCATGSDPRPTWARRWTRRASRSCSRSGGHAVYIDARGLLPHIPPLQYPARRSPARSIARAASGASRSAP